MDPMEDQLGHVDRAEYGLSIRFFFIVLYGNKYLLTYLLTSRKEQGEIPVK